MKSCKLISNIEDNKLNRIKIITYNKIIIVKINKIGDNSYNIIIILLFLYKDSIQEKKQKKN